MFRWLVDQVLRRKAPLLAVGDPAPPFTVRDHLGEEVSLEGLDGKRFVLWFYPKAGTPG